MAKQALVNPALKQALDAIWKRWIDNPETFLFGDDVVTGGVLTEDEHDLENPVKELPDRPHLRVLTRLWGDSQQLIVAKSRQMMITWWALALILWDCLHPGRRWLVVCKKFEDADALLERMWGIYQRLPAVVKPKAVRKEGSIVFHHQDAKSRVLAAAQNTDAPRSQTYSGVFIDEGAFTDSLDSLFAAAKPTVQAGGRILMVSSPNGRNLFHRLLTDSGRLEL